MTDRETGFSRGPTSLEIDLGAVAANWRLLRDRTTCKRAAAVVKADGYGLGAGPVVKTLAAAGCTLFFAAHLEESIRVRAALRAAGHGDDIEVGVLNGLLPGDAPVMREHGLFPVLNDIGQIDAWGGFCADHGVPLPAAIQTDTGMCRLGLPWQEVRVVSEDPARLSGMEMRYLMSHMACGDDPGHPLNRQQLESFREHVGLLPKPTGGAMLAASSASFLGPDWHFDLIRPGAAIYGVQPNADERPMRPVVRLLARIIQMRDIDKPQTVGYGASFTAEGPRRIATVAVGYADGYLRSASGTAKAFLHGKQIALAGRVSMDLLTFDVTDVPEAQLGDPIELLGAEYGVNELADDAGTIGYEVLTSLGSRYRRNYHGGAS